MAHEPLHDGWLPRRLLGQGDPTGLDGAQRIHDHVAAIRSTLERTDYLECGWPCWAAVPWLAAQFPGRLRVVHLVRHPVPVALSWMANQAYCPPLLPMLPEKVLLSPLDDGVVLADYRGRWAALAPFEKALFFWAEVNTFALRCERTLGVPWLRVRFEDLFAGGGLAELLAFLDLPERPEVLAARCSREDQFPAVTNQAWQAAQILDHPAVADLARALGYDPVGLDEGALRRRYCGAQP